MFVSLTVNCFSKVINLLGVGKRHGLSMFLRILHCLNQPLFPLYNKVLEEFVCAWVVELEFPCFYLVILFMALPRSWGYKFKDSSVSKRARLFVFLRLYLSYGYL
jgi:hypothetical protein